MNLDKKWIIKDKHDKELVDKLALELNIDKVLVNLLIQRGITNFEEARTFFRPNLSQLHDPFLMKDMDIAVERLQQAIDNEEKILIYGDYDVDGTTSAALLYSFLKNFNPNTDYYIPDRYSEGYGISYLGLDWAIENGINLIISVDCGIKAIDKIQYAKDRGIDFIICDHHLPDDTLPPAVAILDPKRPDCTYPFDDLSGCGVAFKFVQAYTKKKSIPFEFIIPLLDMVVVSIASDLVSITGENRVLAHFGLIRLNEEPRRGLLSIIKLSGLDKHRITIDDIVFKIGPRINAAGRMESGRTAVDLLISKTDADAKSIGETINVHNNDRKSIDREITLEALAMAQSTPNFKNNKSTIVFNPRWHKGVVGIVASRLVEAFYKPTIVLTQSNGFVTGSARSIPGFDLYEAIEHCAEHLENFGGHTYAAGLTLKLENLEVFCTEFEAYVKEKITKEILTPIVNIDSSLNFRQITPKFFRVLKQFQPFGPGNLSPIFVTKNVYDNGNGKTVGTDNDHMKLELIQEDDPYRYISAIGFNLSEYFEHINIGNPIDLCYSIAENYYRGIANIQLRIKDICRREDVI